MVPKWCFDVEIGSSGQSERVVGRSREIAGLPNGKYPTEYIDTN